MQACRKGDIIEWTAGKETGNRFQLLEDPKEGEWEETKSLVVYVADVMLSGYSEGTIAIYGLLQRPLGQWRLYEDDFTKWVRQTREESGVESR